MDECRSNSIQDVEAEDSERYRKQQVGTSEPLPRQKQGACYTYRTPSLCHCGRTHRSQVTNPLIDISAICRRCVGVCRRREGTRKTKEYIHVSCVVPVIIMPGNHHNALLIPQSPRGLCPSTQSDQQSPNP